MLLGNCDKIRSIMDHTPVTPTRPIAEAGRLMMAEELATIRFFWPALRLSADVTAVHETRKAIRRTFTLFKLFTPYFASGRLETHRVGLRKIMRRLAPCRDVAVLRQKLDAYNESADSPLVGLASYWERHQARVDDQLRAFLDRKRAARIIDRYSQLADTAGAGLPDATEKTVPLLVRHALPGLILQRVGAVRAWGDILPTLTPAQFHQLRIQFKELRYTLTFFEDILSAEAGEFIDLSRRIQEHLGHLNDAGVALGLMNEMRHHRAEAAVYGEFQNEEVARLIAGFYPLYAEFDRPDIHRNLAASIANL